MQIQEIITDKGRDYLMMALPGLVENFEIASLSDTEKSITIKQWESIGRNKLSRKSFQINTLIMRGRMVSGVQFTKSNIVPHTFKSYSGMVHHCLKIPVSTIMR